MYGHAVPPAGWLGLCTYSTPLQRQPQSVEVGRLKSSAVTATDKTAFSHLMNTGIPGHVLTCTTSQQPSSSASISTSTSVLVSITRLMQCMHGVHGYLEVLSVF